MRFEIRHVTTYRYPQPIRLGTHLLRLSPRAAGQRVLAERIEVSPAPTHRRALGDAWGNRLLELGFHGDTDLLRIESTMTVLTVIPPALPVLPPLPTVPAGGVDTHPRVAAYAEAVAAAAGRDTAAFLDALNRDLFTRTDRRIRLTGDAMRPEETLEHRTGACRDLTVLFLACCRHLGLPGRFVSGYQAHAESVDGRRHLHAWPEVRLGDGLWRGYDPTHGLPVTDGHVALAAAPDQSRTMPVAGGYYGQPLAAELEYEVAITCAEPKDLAGELSERQGSGL